MTRTLLLRLELRYELCFFSCNSFFQVISNVYTTHSVLPLNMVSCWSALIPALVMCRLANIFEKLFLVLILTVNLSLIQVVVISKEKKIVGTLEQVLTC